MGPISMSAETLPTWPKMSMSPSIKSSRKKAPRLQSGPRNTSRRSRSKSAIKETCIETAGFPPAPDPGALQGKSLADCDFSNVNIHLAIRALANIDNLERAFRTSLKAFALARCWKSLGILDNDASIAAVKDSISKRLPGAQNSAILPRRSDREIPSNIKRLVANSPIDEFRGVIDIHETAARHLSRPVSLPETDAPRSSGRR